MKHYGPDVTCMWGACRRRVASSCTWKCKRWQHDQVCSPPTVQEMAEIGSDSTHNKNSLKKSSCCLP
eukprot:1632054-Karenia_brevis.AAC.1